ncbi:hypothetical protein [uncultured Dokdonia sp.]|uniref:hypothetical protein n=1 Tax=uncultured Dokdonia sp. TaxID=575653 RepID=UPI0026380D2A|nr:hypothetical protein [uncultured Dokdonia sp.]
MHFKLTKEIIKLSESDYWHSAKNEWNFEYAYYSDELQRCLCGHYPIKNVCVIKNTINKKQTEVGNCCVNKFLGIDEGNKIFTSIKRLKEDPTKSMSPEVLEYLFDKKVLSDFEYKFYLDTLRKRKFSYKQLEIRKKINQKLIDFTSYESNSNFSRINLVLEWAKNNTWFDTNFVHSFKQNCERKGKLTENQSKALENIIKKLKIE